MMIRNHNPREIWAVPDTFKTIYTHATEVSAVKRSLYVSGQFGIKPDGSVSADFGEQCEQAMNNVEALLASAGMGLLSIVKITYLLTSEQDFPALGDIRRRRWARAEPPSVTAIVVAALARPDCVIEIEVTAVEQ
jgi:enamine deaminase RidA (YjgF/YER057c/UK114 family)